MFGKIREFFRGDAALEINKEGGATDEDLHVATAMLLLEMAGRDEDYAPEEVRTIFQVMQRNFGLEEERTHELLEIADAARERHEKLDEFVAAINANFSDGQRQQILAMVWSVVVADGKVDKFERRFALEVQNRLQLSDEQAEASKQMALKKQV